MGVVVRILVPLLLLALVNGCDEKSSSPRPSSPDVTKHPLPAAVMRAMIAPGEPCIRRFRPSMPGPYMARVWASRDRDGILAIEFRSGDRPEFNACIVDAIRAARIPVELAGSVEIPMAFDFSTPTPTPAPTPTPTPTPK